MRGARNGVVRTVDFLRNGYKSIIMANGALKLYLDHKNGAQVYALDYLERSFNACAAYNPRVRQRPNVIVPRESRLLFSDRVFPGPVTFSEYAGGGVKDCSNFSDSAFEYTFKNSPSGVRVLLNCNGGFFDGSKNCPLAMDKVFGLEKDDAALLYSYKLGNASLTDYAFTFGIEMPLALPGAQTGNVRVTGGKQKREAGREPIILGDVAEWRVEDERAGIAIDFVTQKRVGVWVFPTEAGAPDGVTMVITCPIELAGNSNALFTGKMTFKKIKARGANDDSF
jgi:hypothetical protein